MLWPQKPGNLCEFESHRGYQNKMKITEELKITNKMAGLLSIYGCKTKGWEYWSIHILPLKDKQWGYLEEWYDGSHYSFGIGSLLLICWN